MGPELLVAILTFCGPAAAEARQDRTIPQESPSADRKRPAERRERSRERSPEEADDRCETQRVTLGSKAARRHVCHGRDESGARTTESFIEAGEGGAEVYKVIEGENGHLALIALDGSAYTVVQETDPLDPEAPPTFRVIDELALPDAGGGGSGHIGSGYSGVLARALALTVDAAQGQAGAQTDAEDGEEEGIPEVVLSENEAAPPPAAAAGLLAFAAPIPMTGLSPALAAGAAHPPQAPPPASNPHPSLFSDAGRINWGAIGGGPDDDAPFHWHRQGQGPWTVRNSEGNVLGRLVNHNGYYLLHWESGENRGYYYLPGTYPGHPGNLPDGGYAVNLGNTLNGISIQTFQLADGTTVRGPMAQTGTGANGLPTYAGTDGRTYQTYSQQPAYQCGGGGCWAAAPTNVIRPIPTLPNSLAVSAAGSNQAGFRLVNGHLYRFNAGGQQGTSLGYRTTLPGYGGMPPVPVLYVPAGGGSGGLAPGYYTLPANGGTAFHFLAPPDGINHNQPVMYHPVQGSNQPAPLIPVAQGSPLNPSGHPRLFVSPFTGQLHYDQLTPYNGGYFAHTHLASSQPQRATWNGTQTPAAGNPSGNGRPADPNASPAAVVGLAANPFLGFGALGVVPPLQGQNGSLPAAAQVQPSPSPATEDAPGQLLSAVQAVQQLGPGHPPSPQNYEALSLLLDVVHANEARDLPRPVLAALRDAYRSLGNSGLSGAYREFIYAALRERDLEAVLNNAAYDIAANHADNPAGITAVNATALMANVQDHQEDFEALVERLIEEPPANGAALLQALNGFPHDVIVRGLVERLGDGDSAQASSLALLLENYIAASWSRPHRSDMFGLLLPLLENVALPSPSAATRKWALRTMWSLRLRTDPALAPAVQNRIITAAMPLLRDADADVRGEAAAVVSAFAPRPPVIAQLQSQATGPLSEVPAAFRQAVRRTYIYALAEMIRLHPASPHRQALIDWINEQRNSGNEEVREAADYAWRLLQDWGTLGG